MKFQWGLEDVKVGIFICRPEPIKDWTAEGWTAKWTYMIGWNATQRLKDHFVTIALCDGMVSKQYSQQEICDWLNKYNMIPMPRGKHREMMKYLWESRM